MIGIAVVIKCKEDLKTISTLLAEQNDLHVAGTGIDGYDAINLAKTQRPDILIMDFDMQGIESPELVPIIKRASPSTSIIVLYSHDEQDAVDKSFRAGISGCLLWQRDSEPSAEAKGRTNQSPRGSPPAQLVSSIRSVFYGGFYISEKATKHELPYFNNEDARITQNIFSPTELSIFYGIILGHTDKEIAKNLNMTIGALRNCVNRVKHKTGLHNRTQITIHALLAGIINIHKIRDMFL